MYWRVFAQHSRSLCVREHGVVYVCHLHNCIHEEPQVCEGEVYYFGVDCTDEGQ